MEGYIMWLTNIFPFACLTDKTSKKLSEYENNLEFQNNFMNLLNIALYSFSFDGFPDTCNERFFKLNLLLNGYAGLMKDDDLGFITLGVRPLASNINIYGEVNEVSAFGWNGFNRSYKNYMYGSDNTDANAVVCRDNDCMYPMINVLIMYAKRLTDTMRTLDVTARKLKTPYFITCDESQKSSIKKILDDIDFNKDAIIANRSTMPNEFNILQTGANPESVRVLWEHYSNLQAEIRTLLGINSAANLDKKERLVVDEAQANDILTDINIDYRLKSYQLFCDTANSLFDLSISVKNNIQIMDDKVEADDKLEEGSDDVVDES